MTLDSVQRQKSVKRGVRRLDRRSGSGTLGAPKKGGAGGKGTWGGELVMTTDDATTHEMAAYDRHDPNYDSSDEGSDEHDSDHTAQPEDPQGKLHAS
eukprot:jgi/Chlat1/5656/Chrsp37S05477